MFEFISDLNVQQIAWIKISGILLFIFLVLITALTAPAPNKQVDDQDDFLKPKDQ